VRTWLVPTPGEELRLPMRPISDDDVAKLLVSDDGVMKRGTAALVAGPALDIAGQAEGRDARCRPARAGAAPDARPASRRERRANGRGGRAVTDDRLQLDRERPQTLTEAVVEGHPDETHIREAIGLGARLVDVLPDDPRGTIVVAMVRPRADEPLALGDFPLEDVLLPPQG
jgi:hypothetical protein